MRNIGEGAFIGAMVAIIIYFLLPIYGDNGVRAVFIPTGNAISDNSGFSNYIGNLPFSMIVFFSLEALGISIGIISQILFSKPR